MSTSRLILGDCLSVLPTLEAGSVSAIVTDPPYGQSNEKYDRGVQPEVWAELYRVCKPNATLLSFAGGPTYHKIASDIEAGGWNVRQMWAWIYRDGLITSAYPREGFDRLAPALDPICFATKGRVLLNLEREGKPWACWGGRSGEHYSDRQRPGAALKMNGHWPRSVVASDGLGGFQFFALSRGSDRRDRTGHPNQKPLSLMEWLVGKLPGQLVLDPFMGSGTTGVACQALGRDFVGIELDPAYYAIAQRRLAEAQGPLFTGTEANGSESHPPSAPSQGSLFPEQ